MIEYEYMENDEMTDEEVVKLVRTKDRELYRVIISRFENKLLRYAFAFVKDADSAKDITQNTFIKAFINLNGFDEKLKFSSWIYRIAHNEAMNEIVRRKRTITMPETFDPKSDEDVNENVILKENKNKVAECLADMPIIYSEPLYLHFFEERSYEEISDILRLPMGTVGTRISRAKKLMTLLCKKINQ
jgi:RNA polymerase sigma-70 factor (ECF subfamily)